MISKKKMLLFFIEIVGGIVLYRLIVYLFAYFH